MTLDSDSFRSVLGRFASGITIVTTLDQDGRDVGMTVSAFCSVSLHPPLIQACVDRAASMFDALQQAERFVVNVLASEQEALSRRFAAVDSSHRFDGIGYSRAENGVCSWTMRWRTWSATWWRGIRRAITCSSLAKWSGPRRGTDGHCCIIAAGTRSWSGRAAC